MKAVTNYCVTCPLHLMNNKITQQCNVSSQETNNTSLQKQNSSLLISQMRDPLIDVLQGCDSALGFLLVSFH